MKKILWFFTVLMLFGASAFSQGRTVTGTVTDESGNAVPFATVTESGTRNATTANTAGTYSINQKGTGTLTITAVGFASRVVTPVNNVANVVLERGASEELSAVVVTALGITRTRNSLPYAAQQIEGDAVASTQYCH